MNGISRMASICRQSQSHRSQQVQVFFITFTSEPKKEGKRLLTEMYKDNTYLTSAASPEASPGASTLLRTSVEALPSK